MSVRILAIEDDPIAAEALQSTIDKLGYILIQVTDEVNEFTRLVRATIPDLLLIDIELGDKLNGIELADKIVQTHDIPFIFITSKQDSSTIMEATSSLPAAYITKPYSEASLRAAVELARVQKQNVRARQINSSQPSAFFLKEHDALNRIVTDDLRIIEVNNKTCILKFRNEEKELNVKLRDLKKQLPENKFLQVHRSFIVNIDCVDSIDSQYQHLIVGSEVVPIGRSYREDIMQQLHRLG